MLAQRPPMGWNTWNTFGKDINETLIRESADAFIDNGLKDAGYEYLVIDDCWSEYNRDPVTDRIVPHHEKFPNGMKVVADYVHSKGLKFGMYSCDGVRTCADYPGSFDHEFLDAQTFAEFGVDYLKYDNCYKPNNADGPSLYRRMAMALRASGREILFSACNWGTDDVWTWIRGAGAHMYRSTGDINDSAESYRNIALSQADKFGYSAPGCYNDIDMLTVGMYGKGLVGSVGCNDADYRSQFALWCMYSAPLMLGCDIRHMNKQTLELVTDGSYCYEPGFALLSYVESEMTGLEGVVTSFRIEDGQTVTLRRTGKVNAEMVFDRRQAHESLYDVGFGAMMISVVTEDMTVLLNEHGGVLDLDYRVEVEHALCSRNRYHIEIQTI